jgi:pimeloyl-ACP methyl ester carboxylesterase
MKLFYRELGGKGQPIIILHGFLGSSDNWLTQGKMLADPFHVYMIDLRNHGQSPHSEDFSYHNMADDLHEFLITNSIENPILIGHSMGGKVAMRFATTHPELINKLVIVDIAPKEYPVQHDRILEGLKSIPVDTIKSRNEAEESLSKFVSEKDIRQFLLKNLNREPEGGFSWKMNLHVLSENIESIGEGVLGDGKFEKPVLFVRGKKSNYIEDDDMGLIKKNFPEAKLVTLDAGHWVQAEKPQEFADEVIRFIEEK